MKKIILSVIIVFSLLAPALVLTTTAWATTCPVKMPETLLSLYRNSDGIYVGRYNGSEDGAVTNEEESYTAVEIKKHFDISSTLKGKPLKTFTQLDTEYRYKTANPGFETVEDIDKYRAAMESAIAEVGYDDEEVSNDLEKGDDVLLFLRFDEESKKLVPTDYSDGIKDLDRKDIAVYEARIKELSSILDAKKPSIDKLVDWLVSCAEDPVTRWEGTYELERSFNILDYETERSAERKEKLAKGEEVEDEDEAPDEDFFSGRTSEFAKSLGEYHKQTLVNILLNTEFQKAPKKAGDAGYVRGDTELMRVVAKWADGRLAGLLLNRLRTRSYEPSENADMMQTVATILGDKKAAGIADKFSDMYYNDDDDEVDESEIEEKELVVVEEITVDPAPAPTETKPSEPVETPKWEETTEKADDAKVIEKPAMTYKQLRSDLLSKFILRADEVLANPDARNKDQEKVSK